MKFAFIAEEKAAFPVTVLCHTLAVSRAGFYAAQARPPAARARADNRLAVEIVAIHGESRQRYGWTCPGLVDTWVKVPPRPVRAVARTLAD